MYLIILYLFIFVDTFTQNCNTPSPKILNVLTPKRKYQTGIIHTPTLELIFNDSLESEITPNTKSYVSELTHLPSPIKKPKIINSLTSPTKKK